MEESFIIANRTDVGKVRDVNEDSMVTFDSPNGRVIAVCDGMGGQAAGDVASRLACDIITDILTNNRFATPTEAITRACLAANQGIIHKAAQNPALEGMGATCVMVIIKNGLVYYGWIGDSRIYYISKGQIRQLTRDQSYVQQLVDQGKISAAEAENHPQKNQILNALGLPTMTPPELCTAPLSPEPGSVILLCSDGLSGMVDDRRIESIVSMPKATLQRKADMLVEEAMVNGGTDNITVQLIQFGKAAGGAGALNFSNKPGSASRMGMWALIAAAVVVVAVLFIWMFAGGEEEPTPTPQPVKVETTTTPEKVNPTGTTPKKATTSSSSSTSAPRQSSPKPSAPKAGTKDNKSNTSTGNKGNNAFGSKKKADGKATQKVTESVNKEAPKETPKKSLKDMMENEK